MTSYQILQALAIMAAMAIVLVLAVMPRVLSVEADWFLTGPAETSTEDSGLSDTGA